MYCVRFCGVDWEIHTHTQHSMLVRHLLQQRLAAYYAQSADAVVGSVTATNATCSSSSSSSNSSSSSLNLSSLWGDWHWKQTFARLYKNKTGQWLTPVELFQPYYSNTIANFIATSLLSQDDESNNNNSTSYSIPEFDIIEFGGGRGTNALNMIHHLQQHYSNVYNKLQNFHIIDASPSLHQLQHETLLSSSSSSYAQHNADSRAVVRLEQKNLVDVAEGRESLLLPTPSPNANLHHCQDDQDALRHRHRPTFVVACEVLDNLPHDKIRVDGSGRIIQQAEVIPSTITSSSHVDVELQEVFGPLQDALIQRVVDSCGLLRSTSSSFRRSATGVQWIPTVACGVLEQLQKERPNFGLVLADFDWLPPPNLGDTTYHRHRRRTIPAQYGEPLVTSMQDIDYPCYLSAPTIDNNLCDVLFPTDFDFLAKFIMHNQQQQQESSLFYKKKTVQVQKQADFLKQYGPEQVKQTKSWLTGYSPLVDDFVNCSVLTMRPTNIPKIPKKQ